jgi:NAD(P)-dependent dehydrogenase (short-subunit alcohol dehydrogenase family)
MSWALVTGGAKGLGREICLGLAAHGYDVVVHYRFSQVEAEQVVAHCREHKIAAEMIQGDFSKPALLNDFIQRYQRYFPHTRCLINNVGNYLIAPATKTSQGSWEELFQINLHAPFALINALLPSLKNERGCIVNIGTAGVEYRYANVRSMAYGVTKSALWTLTRGLAAELAPEHVRVNMVSPGHMENSVDKPGDLSTLPMRRLGTLAEVVRVVLFLLADSSDYITGQNIDVAGGLRL